jgi:hypothetical protein
LWALLVTDWLLLLALEQDAFSSLQTSTEVRTNKMPVLLTTET